MPKKQLRLWRNYIWAGINPKLEEPASEFNQKAIRGVFLLPNQVNSKADVETRANKAAGGGWRWINKLQLATDFEGRRVQQSRQGSKWRPKLLFDGDKAIGENQSGAIVPKSKSTISRLEIPMYCTRKKKAKMMGNWGRPNGESWCIGSEDRSNQVMLLTFSQKVAPLEWNSKAEDGKEVEAVRGDGGSRDWL